MLAYVAYARDPLSREARAEAARIASAGQRRAQKNRRQGVRSTGARVAGARIRLLLRLPELITQTQEAYEAKQGVDELDAEKLSPLLRLRYKALNDAFAELGNPEKVRQVFVGFQRHLYLGRSASGSLPTK